MKRKGKRTAVQRRRMSEAQQARWAAKRQGTLNNTTIGVADSIVAVRLAKQLVGLMGTTGAKQMVDEV